MKILVINCGSSSLRFQLIEITQIEVREELLVKGLVENIGRPEASFRCTLKGGEFFEQAMTVPDHRTAIQIALDYLFTHVVRSEADIDGVGHRIVHGGEHFRESVLIDPEVERAIEQGLDLAPLHNPHNLAGYRAVRELLPSIPQAAVFDTAFHHTIPSRAYMYAIPYEYYAEAGVRRYGFHGTSHRYVSRRFAQIQHSFPRAWKLITCHLGNGCSVCAVDRGRSVDTSMGFTPMEGLMMGTRSGDVDLGVVLYLINHHGLNPEALEEMFNLKSGLAGISGTSNDMRELLRRRRAGDRRARLAIAMFCYRVRKYLGSYLAALRGADAIIFAGGIGENSPDIRTEICSGLRNMGIILDSGRNRAAIGIEGEISAAGSATKLWVIPTNEELLIARDTMRCILHLRLR